MQEFPLAKNILVPPELNGQRIDQVIAQLFPEISRRAARRHLADGCVFVNGRRVRTQGRPVAVGVELRIELAAERQPRLEPEKRIEVLWEQEELIAISKPSGLPTEPTKQGSAGVASEQLKAWLRARGDSPSFLAAVHRLDMETSGVILFATHRDAAAAASEAFRTGKVLRRYLAVVDHAPDFHTRSLQAPLIRLPGRSRRFATGEGGKAARTDVLVCSTENAVEGNDAQQIAARKERAQGALLYVEPYTGRTHQIRVHLADAGHPITGDFRYGGRAYAGFGLHAVGLSLPWLSSWIHLEAPIPASFQAAAALFGWTPEALGRAMQVWGLQGETRGDRCPQLI